MKPPVTPEQISPPSGGDEETIVRRGRDAWGRISNDSTCADWLAVGEALEVGRVESMRAAFTNMPTGSAYKRAMGDWLATNGFDKIDKVSRSHLSSCMDNRGAIEQWRATLTMSQRLKLNHPRSVLRKWKAAIAANPKDPKPGPRSKIEELEAALKEAHEKIRKQGAGSLFEPQDTAANIARVLGEHLSLHKVHELVPALSRIVKEKQREFKNRQAN
jgi:hypothetical protein